MRWCGRPSGWSEHRVVWSPPSSEPRRVLGRRLAAGKAAVLGTIAEVEREAAERVLAEARTLLANKEWTVTTSLRTGHAAGQLLAAIREFGPDLVVIGAKGRTAAKRFVLGSVAQEIIKYAPCSVLLVRP